MTIDADDVAVHFVHPSLATGAIGPLALISIAGAVNPGLFQDAFRSLAPHRARWASGYGALYLFRAGVPLPDEATRKAVKELLGSGRTTSHACAVLDFAGFWAAAARGVLAGFALVSPRAPTVARSVDEALAWAEQRLPADGPPIRDLGPAIVRFRARHQDGSLVA